MKTIFFSLLMAVMIITGCKTGNEYVDDVYSLNNKSKYEQGINNILKKYDKDNEVVSITNITFDPKLKEQFSIITFDTKFKKNVSFAVRNEYDLNGKDAGQTYIYCEGSCSNRDDCGIIMGTKEPKYIECECSNCKMVYTHTPPAPQKPSANSGKVSNDGLELAKESYKRTFGLDDTKDVYIKMVSFVENEKISIQEITYADRNNRESTFLLATAKTDGMTANGVALQQGKDFTVDCSGSCDCRERFYPATGAIECTCKDCKMTVKEIKNPE